MLSRRRFLGTLGAALAAPHIIRTPGLLMPVKPLYVPYLHTGFDQHVYNWIGETSFIDYSPEQTLLAIDNVLQKCWEPFKIQANVDGYFAIVNEG